MGVSMNHGSMSHDSGGGMEHQMAGHGMHVAMFRTRFFVSIILSIPVLVLSQTIQSWLRFQLSIPYQSYVLLLFAAAIYIYGGWPFLDGLVREVRNWRPGMMTLIGMAISVAFFYSAATVFYPSGHDFFWELATLIDVMLLGHWIEARSVLGASRALEELVKIMPTTAHLVKDGEIIDVQVSDLEKGDTVLVRPGEKIPSDGVVLEGESYVNESFLTGESKPVHKSEGDKVIAGSINSEGALRAKIEKTGEDTYISQVIKLVREAQSSRSRSQDLANRAAALLFYAALGSGIVTYIVWSIVGSVEFALTRSVTVLVIACPHALGLAIPLVVAISTSITSSNGILVRDRRAFEMVKDVNAVVFDKTGTLTTGKFGVSEVLPYKPEKELLSLTAAVESNSEHIIGSAIVDYTEENGVEFPKSTEFKSIPGKGATGNVEGKEVYVGSPDLLRDLGINVDDPSVEKLQKAGKTVVFTVVDGELAGAFGLSDQIRDESREAINDLKQKGFKVYMITGDSEEVARDVSNKLGIDDYFAHVLPNEKAEKVKSLKDQGLKVAMVGDGVNDAPALVTADVGIAIGAGTDVAIESADIILVKNDPREVTVLADISRKTYSKMVQNLWWAAGYNIFAIPLAAGVLASFGVIIDPAVGAILMSMSTVIVSLNSQTLRGYKTSTD
jgi:Cu2+-exporting ATPase